MNLHYRWNLKDTIFEKDKGKVFSCFSGGGGSSLGYKLAGFDVIGCNEIDPRMMKCYEENIHPEYPFCQSIQTFKNRKDLPDQFFALDILDGSPPCSSFSHLGNRDKDWGKEKQYKEGQAKQVLDTLFFDFIELAERLQPKVVIAENVKGLLNGKAKDYLKRIISAFDAAGYNLDFHLIDSSTLGVPQKRERVFFVAIRKDLSGPFMKQVDLFTQKPQIDLNFAEEEIPFSKIRTDVYDRPLTENVLELLEEAKETEPDLRYAAERIKGTKSFFAYRFVRMHKPIFTISANCRQVVFKEKRYLNNSEIITGGTFPQDYNFLNQNIVNIVGMSVPPVMVAKIALRVHEQWLSKI